MAKNDLKAAMAQMSPEEKKELAVAAMEYNAAKQNGADTQAAYNKFRDVLKGIESKYNVTIFVSIVPEAKLIDAIAAKVDQKVNEQIDALVQPAATPAPATPAVPAATPTPVTPPPAGSNYSVCFTSLEEANQWLAQQTNLTITNIQADTGRVSLDIEKIWLEYRMTQSAHAPYQLTEKLQHRFFVGSRLEKFREKWEKKNPELRYIASLKKKWSFSLIGGSLGFFRYVKEKYIVLYTTK